MQCEHAQRQIALPPMPPRIAVLPRDHRGYPIPWFTHVDAAGVPDFRMIGQGKFTDAINHRRCWVCGDKLGVYRAFVIGPISAINRVSAEPPSHFECATWSAKGCPFLAKPNMKRLPKHLDAIEPAGIMLERNPGVTCVWTTRLYQVFRPDVGKEGYLVRIGHPVSVDWFAEGRAATLDEVAESISGGMPALTEQAEKEGPDAMRELLASVQRMLPLMPVGDLSKVPGIMQAQPAEVGL